METATNGKSAAKAKPCTVANPMRKPVKDPGPTVTPIASRSAMLTPASVTSSLTIAITNLVWERGSSEYLNLRTPSTCNATEQAGVEVSTVKNDVITNPIIGGQKKSPTSGEGFYRSPPN